ncbi:unnamed protein product, partial [Musa hybrid cultivar]
DIFLKPYARTPAFDPLKPDGRQRGISAQFAGSVPQRRECGLRVAAVAGNGEVVTTKAFPSKLILTRDYNSVFSFLNSPCLCILTRDERSIYRPQIQQRERSSRMEDTLLKCPDILAELDSDWEVFLDQNVGGDNCDLVLTRRQVIYRLCKAVAIDTFSPKANV